jgi:hypothetical protein
MGKEYKVAVSNAECKDWGNGNAIMIEYKGGWTINGDKREFMRLLKLRYGADSQICFCGITDWKLVRRADEPKPLYQLKPDGSLARVPEPIPTPTHNIHDRCLDADGNELHVGDEVEVIKQRDSEGYNWKSEKVGTEYAIASIDGQYVLTSWNRKVYGNICRLTRRAGEPVKPEPVKMRGLMELAGETARQVVHTWPDLEKPSTTIIGKYYPVLKW